MRRFALAAICTVVVVSYVLADDFTFTITKIDGDNITGTKGGKKGKKGKGKAEEVTLTVAKDVMVFKGKFDADAKKQVEDGDADKDGLKSKLLLSVDGKLPDKGAKDQALKPIDQSKAWLAPLLGEKVGEKAEPAASYQGNPKEAVWLPNEAVAKAWMEYVKTGAVGDTTPPPAPTNVRVSSRGDKGVEITWNAEADFESGIRAFIVLRDGQELAQVPPKPVGKFGRPLFQSMTYHDTPSKPLPEMRYVDASAKPDDKHTYAVITVNSVELKSEPSAQAVQELIQRKE